MSQGKAAFGVEPGGLTRLTRPGPTLAAEALAALWPLLTTYVTLQFYSLASSTLDQQEFDCLRQKVESLSHNLFYFANQGQVQVKVNINDVL